jgi:DNA replication initiation complex subunit (GINS family)
MSVNDQIAAATEELLNIVKDYYKDLNSFIESMLNEIDVLNDKMRLVGQNWNDANFDDFRRSVEYKIKELEGQINRAKDLLSTVKETESSFASALAILRG